MMIRKTLLFSALAFATYPLAAQQPAGESGIPIAAPAAPAQPTIVNKQLPTERSPVAKPEKKDNDGVIAASAVHNAVIWEDPGNVAAKDLYNGPGGEGHQPVPPFTFLEEDLGGTNAKFDIRDAQGAKWHVKASEESRPEVVASRLMWAVGYFSNVDYNLAHSRVENMHMTRGDSETKKGHLSYARFSRKPDAQDKIAVWQWSDNPFKGTREFNGLRVMMAVMNCWDLKTENNAVFEDKQNNRQIFIVNDVGASFGSNGPTWTDARGKGDVDTFKKSKFVQKVEGDKVSFNTPHAPTGILAASFGFSVKEYAKHNGMDWIGNDIPRTDAHWIGQYLGQLTHQQIVDAFRAGNYPSYVCEQYAQLIEARIAELKTL